MTPKGSTGSVHLVTPDNSHPRLARDFPTVADLEDLMPADDSESEPPVWKGFLVGYRSIKKTPNQATEERRG